METYIDLHGRMHHKICINGEPSGNNGYIYSSYAIKVGIKLDMELIKKCYENCLVNNKFVLRTPGKALPPQSRDEVLAAAALGFLKPEHLNGWSFSPFPIPRFSLLKLIKQLYELRPSVGTNISVNFDNTNKVSSSLIWKHRNYFWQNNLDQIYRFAFSVPLVDRDFILNSWGKFQWFNPVHLFYKAVAFVDSKTGTVLGNASGIRFLKYGKSAKAMVKEFPADHPITQKVLNEL